MKRPEALGPGGDDAEALPGVVQPVVALPLEDLDEALRQRLDRRQGVVDLVPQDPDEPLPGPPLLVAQGAREVREDEQLVRATALAEGPAPQLESARTPGEDEVQEPLALPLQSLLQAHLGGAHSQEPLPGCSQEGLARAVHEAEPIVSVEGEDRHVDLGHDGPQEGRGFHASRAAAAGAARRGR